MAKIQFILNSPKLDKALKGLVNGEYTSSRNIAGQKQAALPEQKIIPSSKSAPTGYNGPYKLSFDTEGKLIVTGGVYSVNGDYFVAPEQSIKISSAGYVLLSAEIVNETVTFKGYSIGTLPTSSNGNSIGLAPIGEVRSAGEGKYEIVQWYWGTPMLLIGSDC